MRIASEKEVLNARYVECQRELQRKLKKLKS